ncbi:MAG: P1 family peptidase [Gaiellales bacterium]
MSDVPAPRGPSARERGIRIGRMQPGPHNAVTDVAGVAVGHVTVWRDEPDPPAGPGVARTGVTAIVPADPATLLERPLAAGGAVLNAAGELTGFLQVSELGCVETPVYLTGTMQVGRVFDGAINAALAASPAVGVDNVVIPVVGECDDSWLNDARTLHVTADDVGRALTAAAGGPIAQGAVGAGTGMVTLGWAGGIGTASRVCPEVEATLGVLVLSNFGSARDLRVNGVEVGAVLEGGLEPPEPAGSCIAVVVTDAPLRPIQLQRIARRCGLGLARMGSVAHQGSGEIFLALSTTARGDRARKANREQVVAVPDALLDELFLATVEATEEAVLNAMWAAPDVVGREGRLARGLPHDEVLALMQPR